ncbi:TPA: replicative DNA helicase [Pseudomonas aeruginosa]|nr:replicative DNA helicase [Pseudomonas aeruginosa]ELO0933140.1 replicative DNA helicase [Pseudomonas aeruginosa]MBG5715480.1 replicative DNA helicase [Pseudomonas aeruginosa]MCS8327671.1 replicative DNA helicase [Pseudomonas aeruginosa]MDP5859744.1 replicative DNA helicase [Pseudomonas aeruginosa]
MRDPYSLEAEHGVLGAMMQRPELIDVLADELTPESFYFADNAEVFRAIMAVRSANKAVDFLTVAEQLGALPSETPALAYCCEIVKNTPSIASASTYARIVHERAVDRALHVAAQDISEIASSNQETAEKVSAAHAAIMAVDAGETSVDVQKASDVLASQVEVWQHRHDRYQSGQTLMGISSGLTDLDAKIGGFLPGQLIVVAGRPAMGKTTFAMSCSIHAALKERKSVLALSLEMSNGQLIDRAVASVGKIPLSMIRNGTACEEYGTELGAASRAISMSNLYLADKPALNTIGRVRAMARRHKMRYGLDMLMVDYLQLMDGEGESRVNVISSISRGFKLLAGELGVPVILLSQLSRKCEERPNKRPIQSDLRESGAIEQDADIILFVYRDEVYNEHTEFKGVAEIIIAKGREVETGTVRAAFLGQYNRFENLSAEWRPDEVVRPQKVTRLSDRYGSKGADQ